MLDNGTYIAIDMAVNGSEGRERLYIEARMAL